MPWSEEHYPPAMSHLPWEVRHKAIEIANALLRQSMEEGKAIRIAVGCAHHWADKQAAARAAQRQFFEDTY